MKRAVEIPLLHSKLSWTVSHWYVTALCLLAHSEIGNQGREQGKAGALPALDGGAGPLLVCPSNYELIVPKTLGRVVGGGEDVLHEQSQWTVQPSAGWRSKKTDCSWAKRQQPSSSLPNPPTEGGED